MALPMIKVQILKSELQLADTFKMIQRGLQHPEQAVWWVVSVLIEEPVLSDPSVPSRKTSPFPVLLGRLL